MGCNKIKDAIHYFCGYGSPYDDLVIKTLVKQLPYRITDKINAHFLEESFYEGTCKCGARLLEGDKYCVECGQKLDWE